MSGMRGRLIAAAEQGNLEMVKYCVANECPIDEWACAYAAKTVISRYSNTYAKKPKRLGIGILPLGRLKMVTSTYSNILLSVSMMNITNVRVGMRPERPLRLFEVLTRNRQSALGLSAVRAHKNNHTECVQYLLDNNCPLPFGWRYERGKLHSS